MLTRLSPLSTGHDHDVSDNFSGQNYFPDGLPRQEFYRPRDYGFEREVKKRLEYWSRLRERRGSDDSHA